MGEGRERRERERDWGGQIGETGGGGDLQEIEQSDQNGLRTLDRFEMVRREPPEMEKVFSIPSPSPLPPPRPPYTPHPHHRATLTTPL